MAARWLAEGSLRSALAAAPLPMPASVAAAVVLHGAALAWLASGPAGSQIQQPGTAVASSARGGAHAPAQEARRAAAPVLQARLVAAPSAAPREDARPAPATPAEPPLDPSPHAAQSASEQPASTAASAHPDNAAPQPATPPAAVAAPAHQDSDGYLPRPLLTRAPEPVREVLVPYPAAFDEAGRYQAVLTLYIEADGRVSRVEMDEQALPPPLEHAARRSFEQARFTPGQVDGRIVKSKIRVEVTFDNLGKG